jgi:hypothetical protein
MRSRAGSAAAMIEMLTRLAGRLPSQTRRSEESEQLQQFSTPIALPSRDQLPAGSRNHDANHCDAWVRGQHTSPPPRSEVDCHHELRGVMTTTGARRGPAP